MLRRLRADGIDAPALFLTAMGQPGELTEKLRRIGAVALDTPTVGESTRRRVIEAAELILFSRVLEMTGGNKAKAARWLGVARQTVRDKWLQFDLRPPTDDE